MNLLQAILLIEGDTDAETDEEIVEAWQWLIDSGHAWKLQGWYGRMAVELIEEGVCANQS